MSLAKVGVEHGHKLLVQRYSALVSRIDVHSIEATCVLHPSGTP